MKLQFKTSPIMSSEDMPVSKMDLAVESMDLFAKFLRDSIYSDKILACIRETVTNAYDEHLKHNIDRSVDVKIALVDGRHIWSCRDYALGLDEVSVRNIFATYGRSTKREDNVQVGMFGIGAKSPLGYTDSFYVTSYHNGTKTQYAFVLGGGENGIEVGSTYKISEEPTDETGLEVSVDVTNDYYRFIEKSINFVGNFLPNADIIFTAVSGNTVTPSQPTLVKEVDEYTFNLYPKEFDHTSQYTQNVAIRMGGVVYRMNGGFNISKMNGKIVVDVPIGKLTVPISRENIEDTQSNKKVLVEIQEALNGLMEEDKKLITLPKFGEDVINGEGFNKDYPGEWFMYDSSVAFPDTWKLRNQCTRVNVSMKSELVNDKYIVFVLPHIDNLKNWKKRLEKFVNLAFPNTQYVYIINTKTNQDLMNGSDTLDVSDVVFANVKKLGLPKLDKVDAGHAYLAYWAGRKMGPWEAEQMEEYVMTKFCNDVEMEDEWYKTVETIEELNYRTIGLVAECGTNNKYWTVSSKKMMSNMLELGWITRGSPEYRGKYDELVEAKRVQNQINSAEYSLKDVMFRIEKQNPYIIRALGKNPSKLDRLKKAKSRIINETSTRARIINSMGYPRITRDDLRKILNLK